MFVTDYPKEIKAFYMRLNDDGKTVAAADCLVPGIGEIIGGSQREERLDVLEARIAELGMDPKEIKAFYMRLNDDGKTVAAADCLVPGIGEIIGGSQREERLGVLEARIAELGMDPKDYWWYCDLRRYGSCRHAGFGLGFERIVMYLTGVANIRDVELHPRTTGNADF